MTLKGRAAEKVAEKAEQYANMGKQGEDIKGTQLRVVEVEPTEQAPAPEPTAQPEPAPVATTPTLPSAAFTFLDSGKRPDSFSVSPRHAGRVVRPPGTSQLNVRVSKEARFQVEEYLGHLKRAGRPTFLYEVLDVLLINLRDPEFAAQVSHMLDTTEVDS